MLSPQTVAARVKTMAKRTQRFVQPQDDSSGVPSFPLPYPCKNPLLITFFFLLLQDAEAMVPINEGSSRGGPARKQAPSHPSGMSSQQQAAPTPAPAQQQQQQQPQQQEQQAQQGEQPAPVKKKKPDPLLAMLLAKEGKKEGEVVKVDLALKQRPPAPKQQPAPAADPAAASLPQRTSRRDENPSQPPDMRSFAGVPEAPNPLYNAPEQTGRASYGGMMEPIEQPAFGADYAYLDKEGELDDYYGELRVPQARFNNFEDEGAQQEQIWELPQIAVGAPSRRYAPPDNDQDEM